MVAFNINVADCDGRVRRKRVQGCMLRSCYDVAMMVCIALVCYRLTSWRWPLRGVFGCGVVPPTVPRFGPLAQGSRLVTTRRAQGFVETGVVMVIKAAQEKRESVLAELGNVISLAGFGVCQQS
jgi:hypothetical protein